MSNVLKVKTARPIKFQGKELPVDADITADWNPDDMSHMQMLLMKQVKLVREELPEEPPQKVTKRRGSTSKQ